MSSGILGCSGGMSHQSPEQTDFANHQTVAIFGSLGISPVSPKDVSPWNNEAASCQPAGLPENPVSWCR